MGATRPEQLSLLEISPAEAGALAAMHLRRGAGLAARAESFRTRGFQTLAVEAFAAAKQHSDEAECLAMFADFCRLAGVKQ